MEHQTYELLKRYAQGRMSETERADFEHRLATDAAFAEEAAMWAAIYKGIQAEGDRQLEKQLRDAGKKLIQTEPVAELEPSVVNPAPKKRFQVPRWVYAIAAALLLLLVAWPVYQNLRPSEPAFADNKALFGHYFRLPPAPEVRDAQVSAWRAAYQNKDYAAATAELEHLLADPAYTRRSEANLYLGLSRLASGQGQQALDAFREVSADSFDWEDAQWYSALAYIIVDDVVHAKQTLREISDREDHPHRQEAQSVLNAMK
ncbi:MAG: hypothetical protein DYG98_01410 [Haliscomenobacteraceae bacterium CHB4]|nr:hypothetical protein [Haliscomenobacteraceae bacterium CHB4]